MSKDLPRPRLGHKLHDSFFRVVFGGHLSAAIGALRAVLPARLAAALDFERFEALSGEFVTAALRQRRVDLLFRVWLRGLEARLVWLFEQQAKPLRLMVWRASDYTAAIWRAEVLDHRKAHGRDPDDLPAVIPVVLYTGRRPWSAPRRLTELIDLPPPLLDEARPFLPEMALHVDPLHATSDDALRARGAGPVALMGWYLLKHAPGAEDLEARMRSWVDDLAEVDSLPGGRDALAAMAEYCVRVSRTPREAIADVFGAAIGSEGEELVITTGQMLEAKGKAEGRVEGRIEGRAGMLLDLLARRFGEVPATVAARIQRETDEARLVAWAERLFMVRTPEEVVADE